MFLVWMCSRCHCSVPSKLAGKGMPSHAPWLLNWLMLPPSSSVPTYWLSLIAGGGGGGVCSCTYRQGEYATVGWELEWMAA